MRDDRGMAVGKVAARALRERLETVWSELRGACQAQDHVAHVHQLRVATRRAIAAIDAFHGCIPAKRRDWLEKRLCRLRRAAGEARDLDVLAERIAAQRPAEAKAALARGRLVEILARQRNRSRGPIREQLEKCGRGGWRSRVERLLEDVERRHRRTSFRAYARKRLGSMTGAFFEKADRRLRDNADVHALRIAAKKLRYALEVFATTLPRGPQQRCLHSLERLQETLGDFTDHASAAVRFSRWAKDPDAGPERRLLASLGAEEERRADVARRKFSKWWTADRRRRLRRHFKRTLRRVSA